MAFSMTGRDRFSLGNSLVIVAARQSAEVLIVAQVGGRPGTRLHFEASRRR